MAMAYRGISSLRFSKNVSETKSNPNHESRTKGAQCGSFLKERRLETVSRLSKGNDFSRAARLSLDLVMRFESTSDLSEITARFWLGR
jgi:hypothetical protein